uniref:Uncharacterized protein n=1 Tax=Tanacetum cinerariifolium TaxID=118510 RepID=A0A699I543_TANCI|nr:hypothetical protein [Tanacetum cinerariifolium]
MIVPSGGGLILYQAYGNLYAMTGRKAHLLKDKQIQSVGVIDEVFLALGWHLEEIHVTWAYLEKKRTRLRLYTKSLKKLCIQSVETALRVSSNGVWTFEVTALEMWLLDNDGNPLVSTGIVESDSQVKLVFDETTNLRISTSGKDRSDRGYGTNILLEQWRDSYPDNDDYDPYDDGMYENHDLSGHLQSICDDLDITVRG